MAQVNSEPGKSQTAGTVAVAAGPLQVGSSNTRSAATLTTVSYSQGEPGKHDAQRS